MKTLFLVCLFILLCGCSTPNPGLAHSPGGRAYSPSVSEGSQTQETSGITIPKLMLFGGENNKDYLGCITCSEYALDSIFNEFGKFGSKYSQESIFNQYGRFGSQYSTYSPWNRYSVNGPIIVDPEGGYYGRFTINPYDLNRTRLPALLDLIERLAPED